MTTSRQVTLTYEDPTVWGKCERCARPDKGVASTRFYACAFPERKWKKGPTCPNCDGPLTEMYRIKLEKKK